MMKRIFKPFMMGTLFMLSLTSCGGKSAASMVDSLKNNGFDVYEATKAELAITETGLNAGLLALGKIDNLDNGVKLVSTFKAGKGDTSGNHTAIIYEFSSNDQAKLVYETAQEAKESSAGSNIPEFILTGACYVECSDEYTKGVLGF